MHLVDIIIPTFNNFQYLHPCLLSLLQHQATAGLFRVTVVNNGHEKSCDWISNPMVTVLQPGKNLGWEGGIKLGMEQTRAPFMVFLNDDTFIPESSHLWVNTLLKHFSDPSVGAVGPSSNVVMGMQNIFSMTPLSVFERKFLIGFCFMVRREALEKAGGIDDAHTVADDFDMSIRLRKNGYRLLVDKRAFVYHHGFTTGNKVYGDFQKRNGWNSFERYEMGNHYIIGKHGFRSWAETMHDAQSIPSVPASSAQEDHEGVIIRKMIGEIQGRKILDVGCGHNKTIPEAIGIDMVPKDEVIEALVGSPKSVADIVADVSEELPIEKETIDVFIARHILEHMMDSVGVLRHWIKTIKTGGKMIIAVPNNGKILSIPMNSEHVHAWNPQSLQNLLSSVGLKNITHVDAENGVSFITSGEKA